MPRKYIVTVTERVFPNPVFHTGCHGAVFQRSLIAQNMQAFFYELV